jgi:hypothetical protein
MSTVDDLWKEILADVVTDFRTKNLGTSDLSEGYVGASIVALEMRHCADAFLSKLRILGQGGEFTMLAVRISSCDLTRH